MKLTNRSIRATATSAAMHCWEMLGKEESLAYMERCHLRPDENLALTAEDYFEFMWRANDIDTEGWSPIYWQGLFIYTFSRRWLRRYHAEMKQEMRSFNALLGDLTIDL